MYYLYIDESGDDGDYLKNGVRNGCSSRFFVIGGIIIHTDLIPKFHDEHNRILSTYFPNIHLPFYGSDFALHYNKLRNSNSFPYTEKTKKWRGIVADEVFNVINNTECALISASIDLSNHCTYKYPAHPRFYSLLLLLERFQYFLEDNNASGKVVYESFEGRFHKKLQRNYLRLSKTHNIPNPSSLNRVDTQIIFKRKHEEPNLQFSDFFADVVWIRKESNHKKTNRWESIKHKYYNLNHHIRFKRGNCEV